jgi:hypothetical protein
MGINYYSFLDDFGWLEFMYECGFQKTVKFDTCFLDNGTVLIKGFAQLYKMHFSGDRFSLKSFTFSVFINSCRTVRHLGQKNIWTD